MVCSYLVHHGYVGAAEAFAKSTGQDIDEEWVNIRNRQSIQKLVLAGKMGEAIAQTDKLYPGFLQLHPALHFMLKVRQFIEMVSGNDSADGNDNHNSTSDDATNSNNDVVMNGKEETNGNAVDNSKYFKITSGFPLTATPPLLKTKTNCVTGKSGRKMV
jgi:hypothetical protein